MAITTNSYTGDGSTTVYSISFPYVKTADVKATLDGSATTAFTVSGTNLTFTSAPANGVAIKLFRETNNETILASFQSGSALRAVDMNTNFTQSFFVSQ
jgi:riboflavin synthase alpha subunit